MVTTKLIPGDVVRFHTQPNVLARYLYTQPDGDLAVKVMGTYIHDQDWPVEGTELVEPATEESFGFAIADNPNGRRWRKAHGRKPTLAEAAEVLDERGLLRLDAQAAPVAPPPIVYECLECGTTYDRPGQVEDGGMGCVRCNH